MRFDILETRKTRNDGSRYTEKNHRLVYDSLLEIERNIRAEKQPEDASSASENSDWYGSTVEENKDLCQGNGRILSQAKKLSELAEQISAEIMLAGTRPELARGVTGDDLDPGRFAANVPDCFDTETVQESERTRMLELAVNVVADHCVTTRDLFGRAAALYLIVQALKRKQISIGITAYADISAKVLACVRVCRLGESLDPGRMLYWLGHPSGFRRGFFRVLESFPQDVRDLYGFNCNAGYGHPSDRKPDLREIYSYDAEVPIVLIGSQWSGQRTIPEAIRFHYRLITQKLEEIARIKLGELPSGVELPDSF